MILGSDSICFVISSLRFSWAKKTYSRYPHYLPWPEASLMHRSCFWKMPLKTNRSHQCPCTQLASHANPIVADLALVIGSWTVKSIQLMSVLCKPVKVFTKVFNEVLQESIVAPLIPGRLCWRESWITYPTSNL